MENKGLKNLTPREREIIELIVTGISNKEVGDILYISEFTVKTYLSTVYSNLLG